MFRPNLYPNNKTDGTPIDWDARIREPEEWYVSEKYDGVRLQIYFDGNGQCMFFSRAMKPFRSVRFAEEAFKLHGLFRDVMIEGEFHCEGMMFNEIQRFALSEDVRHSVKKTMREIKAGKWLGRDLNWLTTYKHDFKIWLFDIHDYRHDQTFHVRQHHLRESYLAMRQKSETFALTTQKRHEHINGILNEYDDVISKGGEGLILKHENHLYKYGRNTLKEAMVFKMKDEFNFYNGIILDVLEGTMVDPDLEPEINELGYSVTSKLQEDRMPSGKAKGFEVLWFGLKLTVTLKGFNDPDKAKLLENADQYKGKSIQFIAMKPSKAGGVPRMAKYVKPNNLIL